VQQHLLQGSHWKSFAQTAEAGAELITPLPQHAATTAGGAVGNAIAEALSRTELGHRDENKKLRSTSVQKAGPSDPEVFIKKAVFIP
jgi:hypothetical protein